MTVIPGARARNLISAVDFTVGAEAADVINVAIQLRGEDTPGAQGQPLGEAAVVLAFLSADSGGIGIEASPPTVAVGTDGAILAELVTDAAWLLQSEVDGDIDLDLTLADPGVDTYFLVVPLPNGEQAVSGAITFADQS